MSTGTKTRGLGLQRRIMLYTAVGLGLLFVSWGFISWTGVNQVSELLLEERLATAQAVAASLSTELSHMQHDLEEDLKAIGDAGSNTEVSRITEEGFEHLSMVDEFKYFDLEALVVIRTDESIMTMTPASFTDADLQRINPGGTWPDDPYATLITETGEVAVIVSIPIYDYAHEAVGSAHAIVNALSSNDTLVEFQSPRSQDVNPNSGPDYRLEMIDSSGITILGVGPDAYDTIGKTTTHWPQVRDVVQTGGQKIVEEDSERGAIALAVVPVAESHFYLLIVRDGDVSISAPARLQELFLLIGIVGFILTFIVVGITTRSVVRPTSELTMVAGRMAMGDLDSPVKVSAQDEIAQLAESIETMRVQLARAREQTLQSNQELEQRVTERTDQLRRALGQVISAQEDERKRVSRDLHDVLAQEMIILTRRLDSAQEHLKRGEIDEAELKGLSEMSRANLASIREISRALRPSVLDDLGLIPALGWVANEFERRSNIDVEHQFPDTSITVADEPTLILFRTAQEAFANIERHSGATRSSISLARNNETIELQISDNGQGFDMPPSLRELARQGHLGIIGMLERVELVGGELIINSDRGGTPDNFNTTVTATIPINSVT